MKKINKRQSKTIVRSPFFATRFFGLIFFMGISFLGLAQPVNDNCNGSLTINPAEQCNPITGTTAGATQSIPSCSGSANDDVWYKFTANQNQLSVKVTGSTTFDAVLQVFSGFCGGSSLGCSNITGNGGTEVINLTNLTLGATYWIRVHHASAAISSNPTFALCVSSPAFEPACNPASPQPANSMNPCSNVPKICEVNGFCGTTRGYFATPTSTTYSPYTVDTWPELTAAFCGSIENNSFFRFTASQSTVQLRVFGSCTSGTGIQMMAFKLDAPNPLNCNSGPITVYGCQSPITLNPPPAGGVTFQFTNMVPGQTYYVMVDGFSGAICDYKVAADFGVRISVSSSPATATVCLGNDITLSASGGDGTYTWDPNPDLNTTSGSTVVATPNSFGMKTYVVNSPSSDPDCPGSSDTSFINVTSTPIPDAGIDDIFCFGDTVRLDGTLTNAGSTKFWQTFTPGISPSPTVQFKPNFSALKPDVLVSSPGTYYFILNESNPVCGSGKDTVKIEVVVPTQTVSTSPPICFDDSSGTISIQNIYAQEYSYDGGLTWGPDSINTALPAGTYNVCSRFKGSCIVCENVTIDPGPTVTLQKSADTIVCQNGTATLFAQGIGGNTFEYIWNHTTDSTNVQIEPIDSAKYFYVQAINENGCASLVDSIYVQLFPPLNAQFNNPPTFVCAGDSVAVNAFASGGSGNGYEFNWSNGTISQGPNGEAYYTPTISDSLTVSLNDNCESDPVSISTYLEVLDLPVADISIVEDSICAPAIFEITNGTDTSTIESMSYLFSSGEFLSSLVGLSTQPLEAGVYGFELTTLSKQGCISVVNFDSALVSMIVPVAKFTVSPPTLSVSNPMAEFNVTTPGNMNYIWTFESGTPPTSTNKNVVVGFPAGTSGKYDVDLTVYSDFGCESRVNQIVEVLPNVTIYVPNAFTPDNDDFNQKWSYVIDGIDPFSFQFVVFNRWGEQVWQTKDPTEFWDGKFKGKRVPTGLYNWRIEAKASQTNEFFQWNGSVQVLY